MSAAAIVSVGVSVRRWSKLFESYDVNQSNVLQSITDSVLATDRKYRSRAKYNNLVGVLHIVALATSNMNAERCERLASNKLKQVVWSHDSFLVFSGNSLLIVLHW